MSNRVVSLIASLLLVLGISLGTTTAVAKDYFLTIGGGYDATGNQLSLERNVVFQRAVLATERPDKPTHEVWFADGDDERRDLQCRDPEFEKTCPPAHRLLAEILGDADSMDLFYRNNEIEGEMGPSVRKVVEMRFRNLATELKSGDRVVIYVTAHGSKAKSERRRRGKPPANPHNTSFYFWNHETVSASEFSAWLDAFPRDVQVVMVMVQCYAGGFAHTLFKQADAKQELSPHDRCGFFAQLHDRAAAGCTPDANEADFEEYSSYFWGALAGKSRTGKSLNSADYDKNGQISFAEAHAYAIIETNSIDVPVRTSNALLRTYSQLDADDSDDAKTDDVELATMTGPLSKLLETCRPDQRAILEKLSANLGLSTTSTIEDVQQKLAKVKESITAADEKASRATRKRRDALDALQKKVYDIWPELRASYAPLAMKLANEKSLEFVTRVQALAEYSKFRDAKKRDRELSTASLQLEREKARVERLVQTCEDVVLTVNLPHVATDEIVKRYEHLISLEESTLANAGGLDSDGQPQAAVRVN